MPLEKRMPISQNENIGNFDLFSNITEGLGVGCGQGSGIRCIRSALLEWIHNFYALY